jgi:DNA-binding transcriptional ArsR family regulator
MTERQFAAVARLFAVLAEPMRLRILRRLETGPAAVGEIVADLGTTQANVSKHLKVLHDAGLLARRREGNLVRYAIDDLLVFDLCGLVCDKLARDARRHPWAR